MVQVPDLEEPDVVERRANTAPYWLAAWVVMLGVIAVAIWASTRPVPTPTSRVAGTSATAPVVVVSGPSQTSTVARQTREVPGPEVTRLVPGPAVTRNVTGTVQSISPDRLHVTISHAAIAALDMPAAVDTFAVRDEHLLDEVAVGDSIQFLLRKDSATGEWTLSGIEQSAP